MAADRTLAVSSSVTMKTATKRVLDIAWRRKKWLVVPTLLAVAASVVLVATTPKVYRAATTVLVTRHGVPENLVSSTVTVRIEERMRALELALFSRPYLESVARTFGMVQAGASDAEIEKACRTLRRRIVPELDRQDFSWFRISVDDSDPKRAAGMANRLAAMFIEQNTRMRSEQAAVALEATEGWEQDYGVDLAKRDAKISEFNRKHLYELPDQQPANLQLLNSVQTRMTLLTSEIQARNDHLAALRTRQLAQAPVRGDDDTLLDSRQRELTALLAKYTEENPLVKRARAQIAELVQALPPAAVAEPPADPMVAAGIDPISIEIVAVTNEINALERDRDAERASLETYRTRIGNAPLLEPRVLELTRDYDQVKQQFENAVVQTERARHSQDLESSGSGEQFQIQDPARPPAIPYKPDLARYLLSGLALGLVLGVGATAAREFVDQTVRGEDAFALLFPDLRICGVIPSLDVRADGRSRGIA